MTLAILATGDEIIHGDTLNTNGFEIAKTLCSEGVPLGIQMACSDKEHELIECIAFLTLHHDVIISIGGLGPTTDDRTRFAFARYLGLDLVEYPEATEHIQARLKRANLPYDEGNQQQALFPRDAILFPNPNGTALGCTFSAQNKQFILLPGPPSECLPMFHHHALLQLQQTQHSQKQLLSWQLFGVSEGRVAESLENALVGIPCNTGYRLDIPYLEFKVRCAPEWVDVVKQRIDPLTASWIISPPKQKASQILRERFNGMSESVVILDKATGGILETVLRCPQNSRQLHFYDIGRALFHFEITGLEVYWKSEEEASSGEITLTYHLDQEEQSEHYTIPYRGSAWVLHYAAEWLSFRMLHLIDQIHQRIA